MKILSRYLLREHRGPFLFAFGALTGLLVLNQLARQFGSLVGKGLPWSVIGQVFMLSVPFIVAMTVPMAVLVAVLHAFSRLGADNEITALKASGIDLVRLVRPVLIAATVLGLATFAFVDQILPRTNHQLKNLLIDIARKKPTFELKEQMVNEVVPGSLFLRAGRIDQAADRLRDVVIYDLGNESRKRTIYADSGYMRFNADRTDLYLTLFDGYVHDYDRLQTNVFRRIFFATDLVRVRGVSNRLERSGDDAFRSDREMTVCEMEDTVLRDLAAMAHLTGERRADVENDARALLGAPPAPLPRPDSTTHAPRRTLTALYCAALDRLTAEVKPTPARAQTPRQVTRPRAETGRSATTGALPAVQPASAPRFARQAGPEAADVGGNRLRGQLNMIEIQRRTAQQHAASYQVEIHKKFSIAASCIVFVLIGAPVALRFPRGGVGLVIGASVGIFGVYYVGLIGGETLADALIISPFWSMWGPNFLMTLAGLALFLRLGYEHATSRGGGWGERLRRWRRRA